ncbi:MFS transporter [Candidatus Hepatobacter penaei]|uniref:MFS transporter n=1 Tax=Candidatus Hepatobacter penaei TaxID=1274402 RepID=UPI0004F332F1|nr:MFS transporter [Candidatus Hepatobacter penaei]
MRLEASSLIFQLFLGLMSSLGVVVTMASVPSLPAMVVHFQSTPHVVGWTVTSAMMGSVLCQFFWGPISDRLGRKNALLISVGLAFVSSLLCYWASYIETVLIGRFFQGFSSGAGLIVVRAACRDIYTGAQLNRMIALILTVIPFCAGISPFVGDLLVSRFGWDAPFLFLTFYSGVLFVFVFVFLTKKSFCTVRATFGEVLSSYGLFFKDYFTMLLLLASSLSYFCFFIFIPSSPWIFHYFFSLKGLVLSCAMFAFPMGTFFGGLFQTIWGWNFHPIKMCFFCCGLNLVALACNWLLLMFYPSYMFYIGFMMIFGATTSIFNAICVTLIMKRQKPQYSGNLSSFLGVGQMFGSTLGSFFSSDLFAPALVIEIIFLAFGVAALVCFLVFKEKGCREMLSSSRLWTS